MQPSKDRGLGTERAFSKANDNRGTLNEAAAKDSVKEAQAVAQQAANIFNMAQPLESPPDTAMEQVETGDDGFAAGSDDSWNLGV